MGLLFQSFFWWKLLCKIREMYVNRILIESFNPSFGGSYFVSLAVFSTLPSLIAFQSFFWWKLLCKWRATMNLLPVSLVSILLLVEVTL